MVNDSGATPPPGHGPKPEGPKPEETSQKNTGKFEFKEGREWLGMKFTAKEWTKLMNIMLRNINSFIEKTYKRAIKKMKEDWRKEKEH